MDGRFTNKREKNEKNYFATRVVPGDALIIKFKNETIVVSNIPMQRSIIHHEYIFTRNSITFNTAKYRNRPKRNAFPKFTYGASDVAEVHSIV